ncbi:MAG: hypothetical protein R3C49_11335 [Planctomycetaceae bacterium]
MSRSKLRVHVAISTVPNRICLLDHTDPDLRIGALIQLIVKREGLGGVAIGWELWHQGRRLDFTKKLREAIPVTDEIVRLILVQSVEDKEGLEGPAEAFESPDFTEDVPESVDTPAGYEFDDEEMDDFFEAGEEYDDDEGFEPGASWARHDHQSPRDRVESRLATVRFYRRMNPGRVYPLQVIISKQQIAAALGSTIAQFESRPFQLKANDSIEVEPVIPGCDCYPPKLSVFLGQETTTVTFRVCPKAIGSLEGIDTGTAES